MEQEPITSNPRDRITNPQLLEAWDDEFARTARYVDEPNGR